MKIKVGRTTNEFEVFDDDGNKIKIHAREVNMHLRPNEATSVDFMGVLLDGIEIDVDDDEVYINP